MSHSPMPSVEPASIRLDAKQHGPIQPGGFWARLAAVFVDGIILSFAMTPLFIIMAVVMAAAVENIEDPIFQGVLMAIYYLGYFVAMFLYFGWFYKNKGGTPGKLLLKLKVNHSESGRYIGYWHAFGRETIGKIISTLLLGLGYLMAVFHPQKRALHDLIFRTRVVRS